MTWFKVAGAFAHSLPATRVGNEALGLWVRMGAWCALHSPDGFIPEEFVGDRDRPLVDALVHGGLWQPEPEGWRLVPSDLWRISGDWRPKIPTDVRDDVFRRDGYACVHCGATDDLTVDHVHPRSRGGADDLSNYQTLCRSCNSKKGARV